MRILYGKSTYFPEKQAGLICLLFGSDETNDMWCIHLFVKPSCWVWGKREEEYDMCAIYYGLGPLFLIVVCN